MTRRPKTACSPERRCRLWKVISTTKLRGEIVPTSTAALFASNIPDTLNLAAVLAFTGRRTATARLELGLGVNALEVTSRAGEARDGAGGHRIRARKDRATGLLSGALVCDAAGLRVARRARRRGRGGGSTALTARGLTLVPGPVEAALRRRAGRFLRVARQAVSLVAGPVPPVGRALVHALGRGGRVGDTTMGRATALDVIADPRSVKDPSMTRDKYSLELAISALVIGLRGESEREGGGSEQNEAGEAGHANERGGSKGRGAGEEKDGHGKSGLLEKDENRGARHLYMTADWP